MQSIGSLLDQVFTVDVVMTHCKELVTVSQTDLAEAQEIGHHHGFDLIPVVEHERIIGVFKCKVGEYEPLTSRWLVSRDTPISDLVKLFVETGQLGFFVLHRQTLAGIVTPADLNKLPVRVYIYNLLSEIELKLAALIKKCFLDNSARLRETLGDERWAIITENNKELKQGNVNIDPIQLLYINDLVNLVFTDENLQGRLEPFTKNSLNKIVKLRNQTAHPVRALLKQVPKDLNKLHKRLTVAQEVFEHLTESPDLETIAQ